MATALRRPSSAVKPHRSFDPRRVGSLEAAAWIAYYRRQWLPFLSSAVSLTRHTFGLSWPSTLRGAWLVLRANQLWAPYPNNDPEGARRAMERFYRLVAERHGDTFDARRASELEVEWWRVHRAHQHDGSGGSDEGPLIAALCALYAYVYGVREARSGSRRRAARARDALLGSMGARGLRPLEPPDRGRARRAGPLIRRPARGRPPGLRPAPPLAAGRLTRRTADPRKFPAHRPKTGPRAEVKQSSWHRHGKTTASPATTWAPRFALPSRRRDAARSIARTRSSGPPMRVLTVLVIGYVVVDALGVDWSWLDDWGVDGFEILTGILCVLKAADLKRGRAVPVLLGIGLLCWAVGDIALTIESLGGATPPSPSIADGFYLTFYPVTYIALMLMLRSSVRRFSLASWLDGAVAGFGAAAVCATFAFKDVLHHAGGSATGVAVNLAYPVGDVLLLGLVVGGAAIVPGKRKLPWLLLAAGYALNAVGDVFNVLNSTSSLGSLFNDIAWPVAILLVSIAVWVRTPASRPSLSDEPPGFVLPALAAASALLILFVGSLHPVGRVSLGLAAATLIVAGVRSALSLVGLRTLTEQRRRESVTDQLTGLGNRRALFQLLDAVAAEHENPDADARSLAFMFIDLNRFKEVNDSFGHATGDELLRQLGARLEHSLRSSDLVVRLGGDEFALVLLDAGADYAATVAGRVAAEIEQPFTLDAVRAQIGAAMGIAVFPDDATSAGRPRALRRSRDVPRQGCRQAVRHLPGGSRRRRQPHAAGRGAARGDRAA